MLVCVAGEASIWPGSHRRKDMSKLGPKYSDCMLGIPSFSPPLFPMLRGLSRFTRRPIISQIGRVLNTIYMPIPLKRPAISILVLAELSGSSHR